MLSDLLINQSINQGGLSNKDHTQSNSPGYESGNRCSFSSFLKLSRDGAEVLLFLADRTPRLCYIVASVVVVCDVMYCG